MIVGADGTGYCGVPFPAFTGPCGVVFCTRPPDHPGPDHRCDHATVAALLESGYTSAPTPTDRRREP